MQLTPEECYPLPDSVYLMPSGECLFYTIDYRPEDPCYEVIAYRQTLEFGVIAFDASTEERCKAWIQQQLIHMKQIGINALFVEKSSHWEGIAYLYTNPTRYPVGYATWSEWGWKVTPPNKEEE